MRSGTLDAALIASFAAAVDEAVSARRAPLRASPPCATTLVARRRSTPSPDAVLRGPSDARPAAARQRALHVPRLRGRLAAVPARLGGRRGVDRLGVPGGRAAAVARAARDGRSTRTTRAARCGSRSGHTSTADDVDARSLDALPAVVDRARAAGLSRGGALMRVLAAMSGGVDSAVAAARARRRRARRRRRAHGAVAHARPVPHRLARLLLDRGRGRRAPRGRRARHPVLRVGPVRAVRGRPSSRTSCPSTRRGARPTRACGATSTSSSRRCSTRRSRSGSTRCAPGHYARVDGAAPTASRELHRALDAAKDQSYVLAVMGPERLARSMFPLGDVASKDEMRAEAAARGLSVSAKPDSYDICFVADGDTQGFLRARLGAQPGEIVDTDGRRRRVRTTARTRTRSGSGAGWRSAARGRRQAALRARRSSP